MFRPFDRFNNLTEGGLLAQTLGDDLKIEPDLSRWFPVWGAPGM